MSSGSPLDSLGLGSVQIDGSLTPLLVVENAPTVILIDERHLHDVVLQNIDNAQRIIAALRIAPICVESHVSFSLPGEAEPLSDDTRFADHFHAQSRAVYGIESEELFSIQTLDVTEGRWPNERVGVHPTNYLRSHYFIVQMFQLWRRLNLGTNLMLNVGRKHNDHIADMIGRGEIEELAGMQASYVRLRSAIYPAE